MRRVVRLGVFKDRTAVFHLTVFRLTGTWDEMTAPEFHLGVQRAAQIAARVFAQCNVTLHVRFKVRDFGTWALQQRPRVPRALLLRPKPWLMS